MADGRWQTLRSAIIRRPSAITPVQVRSACLQPLHVQRDDAEPNQTSQHEVGCDKIVEQARKHEDENAEENRENRTETGCGKHHITSSTRLIASLVPWPSDCTLQLIWEVTNVETSN